MSKKQLMAVALAAALSTGMVATSMTPVLAADTHSKGTVAKEQQKAADKTAQREFVKVSDDAHMTMRNVHDARLAIYNGMIGSAQTYLDAALSRVGVTLKDADKYARDTKEATKNDSYVPFNATLALADTFVPTKEKMEHIAKANEHLRKGEQKKAIETLKLGQVDVSVATSLVPVKFAQSNIQKADKLVSEGKYYEANLALKAIEDAVVIETVGLDRLPKNTKGQS